jgi:hypothetical protein
MARSRSRPAWKNPRSQKEQQDSENEQEEKDDFHSHTGLVRFTFKADGEKSPPAGMKGSVTSSFHWGLGPSDARVRLLAPWKDTWQKHEMKELVRMFDSYPCVL